MFSFFFVLLMLHNLKCWLHQSVNIGKCGKEILVRGEEY